MRNKILIITASNETNVSRVIEYLTAIGARAFRLDTDRILEDALFTSVTTDGETQWSIRVGNESVASEEIASIWYRRPSDPKAAPDVTPHCREFVENEAKKFLRNLWSVTADEGIFWLNHPEVLKEMESNKLHQLRLAARVGLRVPETLVTNDSQAAGNFLTKWNGDVIIKTFGGVPIRDRDGKDRVVYTNRVPREILDRFSADVRLSPVMLQNYIEKDFELRITAVHDTFFTCAIYSQESDKTRDDWRRYDLEHVRHVPFALPRDIEVKLNGFMELSGLAFGAIDMIVTPQGDYVFLEVNPSGQWQWIEVLTGMPISRAIAELLAHPPVQK